MQIKVFLTSNQFLNYSSLSFKCLLFNIAGIDGWACDSQVEAFVYVCNLLIIQVIVFSFVGAILSLVVMSKHRGHLTSSIQSLRFVIKKTGIPEQLPNFRQIYHVAVMEAIIVDLVFIEKRFCKVLVTVRIYVLEFVFAQDKAN